MEQPRKLDTIQLKMVNKEIEKSEKKFKELIEATEKYSGELSKEQKEMMKKNYFNLNRKYKT